jgi:hypothetical protein
MLWLESHGFDNAVCVLYENRLIDTARKKVDKDLNRSLIPFKASVLRAPKFSQAVQDNISRFTELADIRGVLAHRAWTELDWERSGDFLMRTFVPTVDVFANEIDFDAGDCFESEDHRAWLKKTSNHLLAQENYPEYVKGIFVWHLAIWEGRTGDPSALQKAAAATESLLKRGTKDGPYRQLGVCPCCKQPAFLFYRFTDVYGRYEVATTGTYAVGLACSYCDLQLFGYRAVDHFKLNDQGFGPFQWTMKIGDLKGD